MRGGDWGKAGSSYFQGIFPTEALVAVVAGKWLHGQMDPLVPLEVVIPVEGLGARVALERALLLLGLVVVTVPLWYVVVSMRTGPVVAWHAHACDSADEPHRPTWVPNIRHDGIGHA